MADYVLRNGLWHVFAENPQALVLVVPGSDSNKKRYTAIFDLFIPNRIAVILMDYEGFGGCIFEGSLTLENEAELWLRDHGLDVPLFWNVANVYLHPRTPMDYDILTYIRQVEEPKLFMHSMEDEVTPHAGGRLVFDTAGEPKTFWAMRGAHGEMIELDPVAYTDTVIGWLRENVLGPESE